MRRFLDWLYDAAGYLAAFFMVGILLMVLASVVGRMAGFNLRGSDAYAGYCMAAASFLALAHTLKRGEHIRVGLFLERAVTRISSDIPTTRSLRASGCSIISSGFTAAR